MRVCESVCVCERVCVCVSVWVCVCSPLLSRQVESSQNMIRIVGLSATLPNYKDVSNGPRLRRMSSMDPHTPGHASPSFKAHFSRALLAPSFHSRVVGTLLCCGQQASDTWLVATHAFLVHALASFFVPPGCHDFFSPL